MLSSTKIVEKAEDPLDSHKIGWLEAWPIQAIQFAAPFALDSHKIGWLEAWPIQAIQFVAPFASRQIYEWLYHLSSQYEDSNILDEMVGSRERRPIWATRVLPKLSSTKIVEKEEDPLDSHKIGWWEVWPIRAIQSAAPFALS